MRYPLFLSLSLSSLAVAQPLVSEMGYTVPKEINTNRSWDLFTSFTFTYWQASQENMELGAISDKRNPENLSVQPNGSHFVNIDFNYNPGFQVGLGAKTGDDLWKGAAYYTWFRGKSSVESHLNPDNSSVTINPNWGLDANISAQLYSGNHFARLFSGQETWSFHMDLLDALMQRDFLFGNSLSISPSFGLRTGWFRQYLSVNYQGTKRVSSEVLEKVALQVAEKSHGWGFGPSLGVTSNWLLGKGVRLFGQGQADLLYTRYSSLIQKLQSETIDGLGHRDLFDQGGVRAIRPHLGLDIGLGWGSFFQKNRWHLDLLAGYSFQVFFDQNMFRIFPDLATLVPTGNLYLSGLTTSLNFMF